jgi:hypothetical protein
MICTLGTEFVHFFLLEQDGEVTLIDAGLSGYRDRWSPPWPKWAARSTTSKRSCSRTPTPKIPKSKDPC